jgi:hypothetical protein
VIDYVHVCSAGDKDLAGTGLYLDRIAAIGKLFGLIIALAARSQSKVEKS